MTSAPPWKGWKITPRTVLFASVHVAGCHWRLVRQCERDWATDVISAAGGSAPQQAQAAADDGPHGFWYYVFHPSQGEGAGYGYYLRNPSEMDTDLEYGFKGSVVVAGAAATAAGGFALAGVNPVLWGGGAAAAGGG